MSKRAKYIVGLELSDINNRRLEAVVFSDTLTHKEAARFFGFGENVLGAGFVDIGVREGKIEVNLSGHSESLNIQRHPLDIKYVRQALGQLDHTMTRDELLEDYRVGADIVGKAKRERAQGRALLRGG